MFLVRPVHCPSGRVIGRRPGGFEVLAVEPGRRVIVAAYPDCSRLTGGPSPDGPAADLMRVRLQPGDYTRFVDEEGRPSTSPITIPDA